MRLWVFFMVFSFIACNEKANKIETGEAKEKSEIAIIKEFMPRLNGIWYSGSTVEHWTQINDSCFQAYVYDYETLDTLERIDVYPMKGAYIFAPTVYGQNDDDPIFFEFKSLEGDKISFTNPSHDWPKEISYQRPKGDSLFAVVSGTDEGDYKELKFKFKKLNSEIEFDTIPGHRIMKKGAFNSFLELLRDSEIDSVINWLQTNKNEFPVLYLTTKGDEYILSENILWHLIYAENTGFDQASKDTLFDYFRREKTRDILNRIYPDSILFAKGMYLFIDGVKVVDRYGFKWFYQIDSTLYKYIIPDRTPAIKQKAKLKIIENEIWINGIPYIETDTSFNRKNTEGPPYLKKVF